MMTWLRLLPVLIGLLACSAPPKQLREPPQQLLESDGYMAGVATADITPPLHLSLFGHGPEGRVATGVRLRLGCEVFVIRWQQELVALVPCDLQSSSMLLQRRLAERLRLIGVPVAPERIYLMATHTHAGPAHYFESRRLSGAFSSIAPGYDEKVLDFLVERIADAVARAFRSVEPVCLGWDRTEVRGLTFNRSYAPFLANRKREYDRQAAAVLEEASGVQQAARGGGQVPETSNSPPGASSAIDPSLFVLRIDARTPGATTCAASGPPKGVLAVFGMHPTAIANNNELYHGDVFGFATRFAQACLQRATPRAGDSSALDLPAEPGSGQLTCSGRLELRGEPGLAGLVAPELAQPAAPIVGLANGIEGDVSPRIDVQSVQSARQLGRELGAHVARLAASIAPMHAAPGTGRNLRAKYWELALPGARFSDEQGKAALCPTPELGIASAGGAQDGPTRLRVLPEANAGFRAQNPRGHCHEYKLPLRVGLKTDEHDFPQRAAIGLVEVDGLYFATIPAEPTTMVGLRVRDAIAAELIGTVQTGEQLVSMGEAANQVAVVGLTNHWIQYVTTEEEYPYQYYEGASNLYGPNASRFFVSRFNCLAQMLVNGRRLDCAAGDPVDTMRADVDFSPVPRVARFPEPEDDLKVLDLEDPEVWVTRSDGDVGWGINFPRLPLDYVADRHKFRVLVLDRHNKVIEDDRGSSMEVREVGDGERWSVRWSPDLRPKDDPLCGNVYRIAIRGRRPITSRAFVLECAKFQPGRATR
jgi:Neutral/alkaline non-lysosomal ceramidase, N-terminal